MIDSEYSMVNSSYIAAINCQYVVTMVNDGECWLVVVMDCLQLLPRLITVMINDQAHVWLTFVYGTSWWANSICPRSGLHWLA